MSHATRIRHVLPLVLLFAGPMRLSLAAQPATTVIVVRHADKATQPAADPPLTEVGTARAAALAAALGDARVTVVAHTPTFRTRETARPVAERFGLAPTVLPAGPAAAQTEAVAALVRAHPGGTLVVVGHSNTVRRWIAALGGPTAPDLCDHEYDGLFTLVIDAAGTRLVHARYGPPNPAPSAPCETMRSGRR